MVGHDRGLALESHQVHVGVAQRGVVAGIAASREDGLDFLFEVGGPRHGRQESSEDDQKLAQPDVRGRTSRGTMARISDAGEVKPFLGRMDSLGDTRRPIRLRPGNGSVKPCPGYLGIAAACLTGIRWSLPPSFLS